MGYHFLKLYIAFAKVWLSILECDNEAARAAEQIDRFCEAMQVSMIDVHRKKLDDTRNVGLVAHRNN